MRLTIAQEPWGQAEAGILPLIPLYSAEVHGDDDRQACLDSAVYAGQDTQGALVLHTARTEESFVVGFLAAVMLQHHQYVPSLWGFIDLWYVLPEYRRYGAPGLGLLRRSLRALQTSGCQHIQAGTSGRKDISRLLVRLGFVPDSQIFYMKG